MNGKRKGTAGENELAEILRRSGIRAYRNDQIYKGGKGNPDVFAELSGLRFHVEVKRQEKLNVPAAVNQAIRDAVEGYFPIVAHRRNREKWLVTMPLLPLIEILRTGGLIDNDQ
jgi:Holliday junction resolvase